VVVGLGAPALTGNLLVTVSGNPSTLRRALEILERLGTTAIRRKETRGDMTKRRVFAVFPSFGVAITPRRPPGPPEAEPSKEPAEDGEAASSQRDPSSEESPAAQTTLDPRT